MRVAIRCSAIVPMAAAASMRRVPRYRLRRQRRRQDRRYRGHPKGHRRSRQSRRHHRRQPGVYLTGSLFLKSGTNLRVDEGVEIRGVQDLAGYPIMQTRVAGIEMKWPAALINVYEQSGVKISGKGIIDGDGKVWWDAYWKRPRAKTTSPRACAGPRTTTASGRASSRSTSPTT